LHGFSSHAHLEALLQPAILTLVPVVLVDRAVAVAATRVAQVPADAPLEEALATFTGELSVVFSGGFVTADDTLDVGRVLAAVGS